MRYLILFISILFVTKCFSQDINWKDAKNWRLYDLRDGSAFNYSLDTLKNFKSIQLDYDTMHIFLSDVVEWPKNKSSLWMGLYVATCELPEREIQKIEISVYGGFFYDDLTKSYFQLPSSDRDDWLDYFSSNSRRLSQLTKENKDSF